jgi:hypothetical protein
VSIWEWCDNSVQHQSAEPGHADLINPNGEWRQLCRTWGRPCPSQPTVRQALRLVPEDTRTCLAIARFVPDSLLEGDGFEPSVPQQIRSDLGTAGPSPITVDSLATRNWKFESISLQRGVCKLSVPVALTRFKCAGGELRAALSSGLSREGDRWCAHPTFRSVHGGTGGSNPLRSSAESVANLT